jgi:hypothetical protein
MSGVYQSMLIAGQLIALAVVPQLVPALLSMALYFSIATALIVLLALGAALIVRGGRAQGRQQPA